MIGADSLPEFKRSGFAVLIGVLDESDILRLRRELSNLSFVNSGSDRTYGVRNLLNKSKYVREFSQSAKVLDIVNKFLGPGARVVRGIYFDKTSAANWKVPWHQDLTIAVNDRFDIKGYSPWTRKAGVWHVQPEIEVMRNVLTLRFHLDDTDETNGALKLLPGTHMNGRLDAVKIKALRTATESSVCRVKQGDCLVMSPLLLHSSSAGTKPRRRRIIHLDYSDIELPGGLTWYGS
jgi:ectoine hydroxylase-related dioxygenase (phytanoyl-CoA dioxygenase family)